MSTATSATPPPAPSSLLIVGSGIFGLSTAHALTQQPHYQNTLITLLERSEFPAPDASSVDSSRIIRADYPDAAYSQLAAEAQREWRGEFGGEGRYAESGICIVLDDDDDDEGKGRQYMTGSLRNVQEKLGLKVGAREDGGQVTVLDGVEAVRNVLGSMGGEVGGYGYVNWTSGWADAEAGTRHLRKIVQGTGRVEFRKAEVRHLLFADDNRVEGVQLVDGEEIAADLTILATGAWTPRLIDLRGIASASGQALAYIRLSQEEQDRLGSNPVLLHESTGHYIIPPRNRVLKIARHGYGYANPTTIPHPEKPSSSGDTITVSLPRTKTDDPDLPLPSEAQTSCRDFLARCIPALRDREFFFTRLCWYTDTRSSDWLIDYHPRYRGLFLATGGSGHGYKFAPVLGERIVDVLMGRDRDELGRVLRGKWKWPPIEERKGDHVWTEDWRGGRKGMVLDEELAMGKGG